jgi:hypothetical protein
MIGEQIIFLKSETHTATVKSVDNDGLESMEIVQLKINGIVERAE